jgi:hypothetical protein
MSVQDIENSIKTIEAEYKINLTNLRDDIENIEFKLESIQQHILTLETSIARLEQLIQNAAAGDKGKMYTVLNKTLELLVLYQGSQHKYLELKYKYRTEQDKLRSEIVRMSKLELPKLDKKEDYSVVDIVKALKEVNNKDNKEAADGFNAEISKLEEDPEYKI